MTFVPLQVWYVRYLTHACCTLANDATTSSVWETALYFFVVLLIFDIIRTLATIEDAAKQLVTSCILSIKLDYCSSLLTGTPSSVIQLIQKVQNSAARLILRAPCHQNCTPLLEQLQWLPISEWIKYTTATVTHAFHTTWHSYNWLQGS